MTSVLGRWKERITDRDFAHLQVAAETRPPSIQRTRTGISCLHPLEFSTAVSMLCVTARLHLGLSSSAFGPSPDAAVGRDRHFPTWTIL